MSCHQKGRGKVQISREAIAARVAELGSEINRDYQGLEPHLICVLNGAFVFAADLARNICLPLTIDFLALSSYGDRTESSGEVELVKDLRFPIFGRHVLVIEDIVDTGVTLNYLLANLAARKPASLEVVALLSKPSRRQVAVPVKYIGYEIEDAYVYGYGLDHAQKERNLPFVTSQ